MNTPLITTDPAGKPVIAGTCITVEVVLETIGAGVTVDDLLVEFPHATRAGILAAVRYAAEMLHRIFPLPAIMDATGRNYCGPSGFEYDATHRGARSIEFDGHYLQESELRLTPCPSEGFKYDANGRTPFPADGFKYDDYGRPAAVIDPLGQRVRVEYDTACDRSQALTCQSTDSLTVIPSRAGHTSVSPSDELADQPIIAPRRPD